MQDCIFCKIIAGEVPATVVYADERFVAIRDLHPQAAVHVLLLPRRHWADLLALAAGADVACALPAALAATARACGIQADGFRVVVNCGAHAGQTVDHLHFHLLGGEVMGERIR